MFGTRVTQFIGGLGSVYCCTICKIRQMGAFRTAIYFRVFLVDVFRHQFVLVSLLGCVSLLLGSGRVTKTFGARVCCVCVLLVRFIFYVSYFVLF